MIAAEEADFPVSMMCELFDVSRSGFYAWKQRESSKRQRENEALKEEIKEIHRESRETYGSPRVHAELRARGFEVGRNRVARLMHEEGVCGRRRPKFARTTNSAHDYPIAPNVLEREFTSDEPDKAWVADITYIWTNRDGSIWRLSSTSSRDWWSAGRWPTTCAPSWSSTRSEPLSAIVCRPRRAWSSTPIAARSTLQTPTERLCANTGSSAA